MFKKITAAFVASQLFVLISPMALAQSENPEWLDYAIEQLAEDKSCEVGFFVSMRESELGGKLVYEARAQCVDGRQFDVSKITPAVRFEIKECNVAVC